MLKTNVPLNLFVETDLFVLFVCSFVHLFTTRIPKMLGRFLNLNKILTKRLSNHMSQYFIHNGTGVPKFVPGASLTLHILHVSFINQT